MKLILLEGILLALLGGAGGVMTDEDVVRLFVSGSSAEEIIDLIESSEVHFDLSDEMLVELRAAGLPQDLILAMVARQAEMEKDEEPPPAIERPGGPLLRIEIDGGKPVQVLDVIDGATRELLRLREADSRFTAIAIFLACLTPDHVPDNWRGESPMGRDFIGMPRHRMLYFHSGAVAGDIGKWKKRPTLLELELPAAIEVELAPGVSHDLMLGVALRAEDKYYLVASDERQGLVLQEEGVVSGASVSAGRDRRRASLSVQLH